MNKDSILFAMANPVPEIMPDVAKAAGARVVGTGRSDFPNQVNNVIAFPGIFKGALEGRATQITEEMKLAAAEALAHLVSDEELNDEFIMPEAFDPRVAEVVSQAVKSYLRELFTEAIAQPDIAALSIATRCDCLPPEVLDLLSELNCQKPVWIELGLQSIHNDTLRQIRSGFTYEQYLSAVDALKDRGLSVITHLILGLPGETEEMMLASVDAIAHLPIDGVKLQLLHVLKNTDLALLYEKAPFPVFSLEEYCDFVVTCIEHLPPEMVIHRLTGDGPRSLLIAPLWSTDKKRVLNTIQKRFRERGTWQGKCYTDQEVFHNELVNSK